MGLKDKTRSTRDFCSAILRLALRSLQLVLALAVAGLYGTDLNNARKNGLGGDSRWIYAEVVAGLSGLTALIFMIPYLKIHILFVWDAFLCLLWLIVFGIFGKIYIQQGAKDDVGIQRMKNAVWVDLVNMLLWFVTAVWGAISWRAQSKMAPPTSRSVV
ncbi:MAG: hypothetical protein M1817_000854 [Caeruleum heppii]|nr:MAG: hypothetical protein M1817_000854 [Caeruleum heppii]